jgi:superoxide reductase
MIAKNQIYKCNVCGNIVQVLYAGGGILVCCGQNMKLLTEKTQDEGNEKHVPVIEKNGNKVIVKVGSVTHPMEEKHFIQWIELLVGNKVYHQLLQSTDKPEATFEISQDGEMTAREYCNLHGLWKS